VIHKKEIRCTQKTAIKAQEMHPVSPWTVLFGPTFDIPVVISEGIPEGKIQFWKDDEMLWELTIEEV
jgi:hypothetical protein